MSDKPRHSDPRHQSHDPDEYGMILKTGQIPDCMTCIYSNGNTCARHAPMPMFPAIDVWDDFCGEGLWLTEYTTGLTSFETIMEIIERRNAKKR